MFNRDEGLLLRAGVGAMLRPLIVYTHPTGSNYTCNPPVTNTDIDFYAFTNVGRDAMNQHILDDGWESCVTEIQSQAYVNTPGFGKEWMAYRKDNFNLMIVYDTQHFARCVAATEMCKALNLLSKQDRVDAHSLVHLDKDLEFKLPNNRQLRTFINGVKSTDWWDTNPPVRQLTVPQQIQMFQWDVSPTTYPDPTPRFTF